MTSIDAQPLRVVGDEEHCKCLASQLWQVFLSAAAWVLLALALGWLIQTAQATAPAALWWKSLLALGCMLCLTHVLRVLRRLDAYVNQGWTVFDVVLLLAGACLTAILAIREGVLISVGLIAIFLLLEGLSLWRLNLVPRRLTAAVSGRFSRTTGAPIGTNITTPNQAIADSDLNAVTLSSTSESDPAISQQLVRRELEDAIEISGFVRGEFAAGELHSSVDIAFCPTLPSSPQLEFEPICDGEIEAAISTLKPYGARLELTRRGDLQEPLSYTLELHVRCEREIPATESAIHEPADS
jgi:hypothetical protein